MFEIPFTQYLLPNGVTRAITWPCKTHEQEEKAKVLLDYGVKFEAEMLQTGEISLTAERDLEATGETETLAHEIAPNNSEIISAVDTLVATAYKRIS